MNQFVAPQFIDVEDRIIGPITTRQFVMMIGGGIVIFIASRFLDTGSTILDRGICQECYDKLRD